MAFQEKPYIWVSEQLSLLEQGIDTRFFGQNRVKKVDVNKFLNHTPKGCIELLVALPDPKSNKPFIDSGNAMTRQELNKIRLRCQVYIDVEAKFIKISVPSRDDRMRLRMALKAVREFLHSAAKDMGCKMIPLIHQTTEQTRSSIILKSTKELQGISYGESWFRGISRPLVTEDSRGPDEDLHPLMASEFLQAVGQAATSIRPVLGEMQLRIRIGILTLQQRKMRTVNSGKVPISEYSLTKDFKEYLTSLANRGVSYVHHNLGGGHLAQMVRDHICSTYDRCDPQRITPLFVAPDPTIVDLNDVKPKYCLVLFSKDRRIEIDVQYEPNDPGVRPTASSPRIFYAANRKPTLVEVTVSCPGKKFDWHLSVDADNGAKEISRDIINLVRAFQFGPAPMNTAEFPSVAVNRFFLNAAEVDEICCKVSWTFESVKAPYYVEVSVYHDWPKHDSPLSPASGNRISGSSIFKFDTTTDNRTIKSCGIAMYGQDWDQRILELNPSSRQFAKGFRDLVSGNDGAQGLLNEVEYILDLLTDKAGGPEQ